jgi:hypothetical protein
MGYWIDGYFSPFCHELCNRSLNNLSVLFVFQIHNVTAKYIMKTDDDTFVRVDKVLAEIKATSVGQGLYMGSMNEFHRPLRTGKWAVTFEEWPERIYPTYANGPGYILSKDIAQYIVSQSKANTLRVSFLCLIWSVEMLFSFLSC